MSRTLCWRPVLPPPEGNGLELNVAYVLMKAYDVPDNPDSWPMYLGSTDLPNLHMLMRVMNEESETKEDLEVLINKITRFGKIELYWEY